MPSDEEATDAAVATDPFDPGFYIERTNRFRASIETIRRRSELTAKALGTLGTTALTAVGIAKFADIFPLPTGWTDNTSLCIAVGATVGGFALLGIALAAFTARLWRVNAPLFVSANEQYMKEEIGGEHAWNRKQWRDAKRHFDDTANARSAPSLQAFQARADRLERIAIGTAEPRRGELLKQAAAIRAEVDATTAHVGADVVRNRATRALSGPLAATFGLLFLVGLIGFAVGADYLDSERTGRSAVAVKCAEAAKALDEQRLPATVLPAICAAGSGANRTTEHEVAVAKACADAVKAFDEQRLDTDQLARRCTGHPRKPQTTDDATSDSVSNAAVSALGTQLGQCYAAAKTAGDRAICRRLRKALEAAAQR